jgi:EmrB/QacA subfamily drug resistance transporter
MSQTIQVEATTNREPLPSSERWIKLATLISICVSTFMLPLDYTIVAVALHDIQLDLGASFIDLQWVVNGYTLTFAAFLLAGGAFADLFGRRRLYVSGMIIFMLSSLSCGLAPDALILNIARAVQGVGAAVMFAAALPLLVREFEGPERARAFGIFGAVVGIGAALGPFLGGILVGTFGWRWAFLVNVPVTAIIIALTLWRVRESKDPNAGGIDWGGFATFTAACFLLVYALITGNAAGWSSPSILGLFAATALLLIAFVVIELGRRYPMFDLSLFKNATFIGASIPPLTLSIAFWGVFLYFPLYYQAVLGYTPLQAGAAVLPFALPLFIMGPVGGWLATRISSRLLLGLGQGLVGIGSLVLLVGAQADAAWSAYVLGGLISGTGAGLINGEMTNVAISIVPEERSGMASGINGTMRQVGVALGFAGLGAILANRTAQAFMGTTGDLGLPAHQMPSLLELVVKGDIAGATGSLPTNLQQVFRVAADTSMFEGFRLIVLVAGIVGVIGALLTYVLVGPPKRHIKVSRVNSGPSH